MVSTTFCLTGLLPAVFRFVPPAIGTRKQAERVCQLSLMAFGSSEHIAKLYFAGSIPTSL